MTSLTLIWAPVTTITLNPENARTLPFTKLELEDALEELEWSPDYLKPPLDPKAYNQEESLLSLFLKRVRDSNQYSSAFSDALESLTSLAAAIGSPHGLIQPITAMRSGNGWVVSSGNRRLLAHVLMGADEVKLIPMSDEEASEQRGRALLELQENISREDLSLIDELMGVKRVLELHGLSPADLSINSLQRMIGWTSRTRAQRIKDVLSRDKLVELIEAGVWSDLLPAWQARHEVDDELDARLAKHRGEGGEESQVDTNEKSRYKTQEAANRILKIGGSAKHQGANKLNLRSMVIGHHAQGLISDNDKQQYLETIEIAGKDVLASVLVELNQRSIEGSQ